MTGRRMETLTLSARDKKQIKDMGLSSGDVTGHWRIYCQGPNYAKLIRPCTLDDGILACGPSRKKKLIQFFEEESRKYKLVKFVPASGAASRMFARWYETVRRGGFEDEAAKRAFYRNFKNMPFFEYVQKHPIAGRHLKQKNTPALLEYILSEEGMKFGWLPKALIPFHAYPEGNVRTAIEEHLIEAASIHGNSERRCHLHMTLSEEHVPKVRGKLKEVRKHYEEKYQVRFKIDYSIQATKTNRLAVREDLSPFRDEQGNLVFRPGGHGSLLENLAALDADFIFVKNIDNIVNESNLQRILPYKKMLGGLAIQLQKTIFDMLKKLEGQNVSAEDLRRYADFCRKNLNIPLSHDFDRQTNNHRRKKLFSVLNRPLRICAMVKNEGEPGGGPFWVEEKNGEKTVQIVEYAHVDSDNEDQQALWRLSSYFNPVDMVCCIRDYRGGKFDLKKFVNRDAYLIGMKTEKGINILAQELPGLWNGGMAYWNSVFVELPVAVFNPVKTVDDLLRRGHTSGRKRRNKTH